MVEREYSNQEMIRELHRVTEEIGKSPSFVEFQEHGEIPAPTVQDRFGGWNDAKEKAGLSTSNARNELDVDEEMLLNELEKVDEKVEGSPTAKQFNEYANYCIQTVRKRFGGWNKFKEEAGMETNSSGFPENASKGAKASIEEIIEDLENGLNMREVAEKHGYTELGTVSSRLSRLGYKIRSGFAKNKAGYGEGDFSAIVSISGSVLEELGIGSNETFEDAYYDMETFEEDGEKGIKITLRDQKVYKEDEEEE